MQLYFAYGSNLSTDQMKRRCPGSRVVEVGCLKNHRLAFTRYSTGWNGGVADVVPDLIHDVWGLIHEVTTYDLEKNLDEYEGCPDFYRRAQMPIQTVSGKILTAWVYSVVHKSDFVAPTMEYMTIIKKAAEELRFPETYRSYLETIRTK